VLYKSYAGFLKTNLRKIQLSFRPRFSGASWDAVSNTYL